MAAPAPKSRQDSKSFAPRGCGSLAERRVRPWACCWSTLSFILSLPTLPHRLTLGFSPRAPSGGAVRSGLHQEWQGPCGPAVHQHVADSHRGSPCGISEADGLGLGHAAYLHRDGLRAVRFAGQPAGRPVLCKTSVQGKLPSVSFPETFSRRDHRRAPV